MIDYNVTETERHINREIDAAEEEIQLEQNILDEIVEERNRQHDLKHGGNTEDFDKKNTKNDWVSYICAYAGRAADKCLRNEREEQSFRANMVKVAALAVAAIVANDKGYFDSPVLKPGP